MAFNQSILRRRELKQTKKINTKKISETIADNFLMRIPSKFLFLPFILTRFLRMRLLMTPRHLLLIPMVRVLLSIEIRWVRLVLNKAMGQQQDQEQERVLRRAFTLQRLSYLVFCIIFYLILYLIFCLIFCLLLCPYLSYDIISPLSSPLPTLRLLTYPYVVAKHFN